jgi:hypothetical protein
VTGRRRRSVAWYKSSVGRAVAIAFCAVAAAFLVNIASDGLDTLKIVGVVTCLGMAVALSAIQFRQPEPRHGDRWVHHS